LSDLVGDQAKAWNADLVVIGTHGRRGVNRLMLGSDAEQIVRTSPVPVLLVRAVEGNVDPRFLSRAYGQCAHDNPGFHGAGERHGAAAREQRLSERCHGGSRDGNVKLEGTLRSQAALDSCRQAALRIFGVRSLDTTAVVVDADAKP